MRKDNQADILMSHNAGDNALSASDLWPKNKKRKSKNSSEASDTRPSKRAKIEEGNKIITDTDLEVTNSENIGNLSDSSDISSEMTGSQVSEEDSEVEVEILSPLTLETNQLIDHKKNINSDKHLVLSNDVKIHEQEVAIESLRSRMELVKEEKAKYDTAKQQEIDELARQIAQAEEGRQFTKIVTGEDVIVETVVVKSSDETKKQEGEVDTDVNGIVTLRFWYQKTNNNQIGVIVKQYLEVNPNVTKIDFTKAQLTAEGLASIFNVLDKYPKVDELNFYNNNFFPEGAMILANFLKINTSIKVLDLGQTSIDLTSISILVEGLADNKVLEFLSLYNNDITDESVKVIAKNLPKTSITALDLGANEFTTKGAEYIAESINNTKITKIFFALCNLNDEAISLILQPLVDNEIIKEIDLFKNCVGDNSTKLLADVIKSTKTLKKLDLGRNQITEDGAAALGKALESNSSVENLNLTSNKISDSGVMAMANAIVSKNSHLSIVDMSFCTIGDKGAEYLVQTLLAEDLSHRKVSVGLGINNLTEACLEKIFYDERLDDLVSIDEPASVTMGSSDSEYSE